MGSRVSPRMKSSASRYSNTQQASVELSGPTQPLDSHFRLRFPVSTPPSATLFSLLTAHHVQSYLYLTLF